jgi:hypothetical protein
MGHDDTADAMRYSFTVANAMGDLWVHRRSFTLWGFDFLFQWPVKVFLAPFWCIKGWWPKSCNRLIRWLTRPIHVTFRPYLEIIPVGARPEVIVTHSDGTKRSYRVAKVESPTTITLEEPSEFRTDDGYTFHREPDGKYTDGDMTFDSLKELMED